MPTFWVCWRAEGALARACPEDDKGGPQSQFGFSHPEIVWTAFGQGRFLNKFEKDIGHNWLLGNCGELIGNSRHVRSSSPNLRWNHSAADYCVFGALCICHMGRFEGSQTW